MASISTKFCRLWNRKNGKFRPLRSKLSLSENSKISLTPLSRSRYLGMRLTYKMEAICEDELLQCWVVRFSPPDENPWYDVKKEGDVLKFLKDKPVPVPKLRYCSTDADRKVLGGVDFIIMDFVEGKKPQCIQAIPKDERKHACFSVMAAVAKLHHIREGPVENSDYQTATFWDNEVSNWERNYHAAIHSSVKNGREDKPSGPFFQKFKRPYSAPKKGECCLVHRSLDISNVIFNENYDVKAILDWRHASLGDPNVDLAYFFTMFLNPSNINLKSIRILVGTRQRGSPTECNTLQRYKESRKRLRSSPNYRFSNIRFRYARAVCCLRMISVLKAAEKNNFLDHECHPYIDRKGQNLAPQAISFLVTAGEKFLEKYQ